jgi:hypothetical protein
MIPRVASPLRRLAQAVLRLPSSHFEDQLREHAQVLYQTDPHFTQLRGEAVTAESGPQAVRLS